MPRFDGELLRRVEASQWKFGGPVVYTNVEGRYLGKSGEQVSVLAFRGGGLDTVMYLGVIQAWLLLKRPPPNLVTGVSAGAVAAAAMGEVYQAGDGKTDTHARHEQARRLRELVLAYISAPRELLQAWFPDTYEVNADRPLVPLQLPTQFEQERRERDSAVRSKFGLIKLFNTILALDLEVSVVTRIVRHVLELSRLKEEPSWRRRLWGRLRTVGALWLIGATHPFSCSLLLRTFVGALGGGRHYTEGQTAAELLSYLRISYRRTKGAAGRVAVLLGFVGIWVVPPASLLLLLGDWLTGSMTHWGWPERLAVFEGSSAAVASAALLIILHNTDSIAERLLRRFDLDAELSSSYDLEQFLVRHFDPSYYGRLDVTNAVDRALERSPKPQTEPPAVPKSLGDYHQRTSICVAPAVADLGTGELRLLGPEVSVVESLMASMAVAPFFKARTLTTGAEHEDYRHSFVDGVNVANEPISALMDYLRDHVNADATGVTVYTVAPFPSDGAGEDPGDFSELMDIVQRVATIQRVQTLELERAVTNVYSRLLPSEKAVAFVRKNGAEVPYVNARIQPIDAEDRLDVNSRILAAQHQAERAKIIYRAIAAGCRATLCEGLGHELPVMSTKTPGVVSCRKALRHFWKDTFEQTALHLKGSDEESGPGLAEICRECSIGVPGTPEPTVYPVSLRVPKGAVPRPPVQRVNRPCAPWVTMALSGGVFRGVFQLGVLNALSELDVRPRLIAGSSVGSIMAAFGARLSATRDLGARRDMMRSAAETFLALDLLIPTDRFADFIRRFTLRAGAAGFSIRDADLLFRRYDVERRTFSHTARRVIAGLERLFYVTPFEVKRMTEALRQEDFQEVSRLGKRYLQDFLERSGIGLELLGAEPLKLLIDHLVLQGATDARKATLALFQDIALIVTATNLNRGELCVFGMGAATGDREPSEVNLTEALLASSAFPGVFRPRSFAEVTPYETCGEVLVDGGVTDNLPLHSVARFLAIASDTGRVCRRPTVNGRSVPHLVLTASLEPKWTKLNEEEAETVARSWLKVQKRTKQLRYNRKVDAFAKAQRQIRHIWNENIGPHDWTPLDLEVITVKPEWLPPTFGFHPMLGFRRARQAASIAHGCASTMAKLAHICDIGDGWHAEDWGFSVRDILPQAVEWNPLHHQAEQWTREPVLTPVETVTQAEGDPNLLGRCWFRGNARCPFYANGGTSPRGRELNAIYEACGKRSTHEPPD